jgi:hypothetical protein
VWFDYHSRTILNAVTHRQGITGLSMPQCKNSSTRIHIGALGFGLSALLIAGVVAEPGTTAGSGPDSRLVYSSAAPSWLRAVGQLRVPGSKYTDGHRTHLREDCSGTLVTRFPDRPADTVITAWHCLAHYSDLSKPIMFTLLPGDSGAVQQEAYRLADGGGMHADWAILRLRHAVAPELANALLIDPGRADPARAISMAGYSRDEGMGDSGKRLTFDPACLITAQRPAVSDSDCRAHKGASGGAVVQLSVDAIPRFSGVVSEGDGAGVSTFVPVAAFRNAISLHLD